MALWLRQESRLHEVVSSNLGTRNWLKLYAENIVQCVTIPKIKNIPCKANSVTYGVIMVKKSNMTWTLNQNALSQLYVATLC